MVKKNYMTRRLPSLNALRAFEAVARQLSFVRAAEELHVTPAAVSQLVKQLEGYLGTTLFRRGRQLALSESASVALPLVSEAFDQLERAVARLRAGSGRGSLVVSVAPTFAARWLIPRLEDFHARHPDIELRLLATRRLVDFVLEDVDVAIRLGSGAYPGLHVERVIEESIVVVAAPAIAGGIRSPADLVRQTFLWDEWHSHLGLFPGWESLLAAQGVAWNGALRIQRFSDSNLAIQAALAGLGVTLAWRSLVADDLKAGRLVQVLAQALPSAYIYSLVMPPGRLALAKVAAFRDWLLAQVALEYGPPSDAVARAKG